MSLAGWLASLTPISPHAPTLETEGRGEKKKKNRRLFLFKMSNHCTVSLPLSGGVCYSLREKKTDGQIVFSNHLRCPCFLRRTTTQPPLCVARRHCGKFQREALSQAHSRMWRNPQSARTEADTLLTISIYTSDPPSPPSFPSLPSLPLPFHPLFLSYLLSLAFSSPTTIPRCACKKKISLVFPPAYSQRDFPESAFDLCTMLRGASSVHTQWWVGTGSPISSL